MVITIKTASFKSGPHESGPAEVGHKFEGDHPMHQTEAVTAAPAQLNDVTSTKLLKIPGIDMIIAIISHSYAGTPVWDDWPDKLETMLQHGGVNAKIFNCSIDANTFLRSNTVAIFGANTAVQQAIALVPDIVIVQLAANDCLNQNVAEIPLRSLATLKADADLTFSDLRAGIPATSKIIYVSTEVYDSENVTLPEAAGAATIYNKQVLPYWQGFGDATNHPGDENSRTPDTQDELAPNVASATGPYQAQHVLFRERLTDWGFLDTHIKTVSDIDYSYNVRAFKCGRLGLTVRDGVHPSKTMNQLLAAYAYKFFLDNAAMQAAFPVLNNLLTYNQTVWHDPDALMGTKAAAGALVSNGTGWDLNYRTPEWDVWRRFCEQKEFSNYSREAATWYHGYPVEINIPKLSLSLTADADHYMWVVNGGAPLTPVEVKVWQDSEVGVTYVTTGTSTDNGGFAIGYEHASRLAIAPGTWLVKYRVGLDVSDEFSVVLT